jgi:hypothetical protein
MSLAAEAGIAIFKVGFERWLKERRPRDFAAQVRAALDALRAVTADGTGPKARSKPRKTPTRRP